MSLSIVLLVYYVIIAQQIITFVVNSYLLPKLNLWYNPIVVVVLHSFFNYVAYKTYCLYTCNFIPTNAFSVATGTE